MKLINFYSYSLAVLSIIYLLLFLLTGNPAFVVSAILPALVSYLTIRGIKKGKPKYIKVGGIYYGLCALMFASTIFLTFSGKEDLIFSLFLILCTIFFAHGSYVLLLKKVSLEPVSVTHSKHSNNEHNLKEFDYDYKGYDVYKSPKFYWHEESYFSGVKEVEAHIEDLIAAKAVKDNPNTTV